MWYFCPRLTAGRGRKFKKLTDGPFRVVRILNDVNYVIQKTPSSRLIICHVDRLLRYEGDPPAVWVRYDEEKSRTHLTRVVLEKTRRTFVQESPAGPPRSHSNRDNKRTGLFQKDKRACLLGDGRLDFGLTGRTVVVDTDPTKVLDSTDSSAKRSKPSAKSDLQSPKVREQTRPVKYVNRSRDLYKTRLPIKGPRNYRKTMTVHQTGRVADFYRNADNRPIT